MINSTTHHHPVNSLSQQIFLSRRRKEVNVTKPFSLFLERPVYDNRDAVSGVSRHFIAEANSIGELVLAARSWGHLIGEGAEEYEAILSVSIDPDYEPRLSKRQRHEVAVAKAQEAAWIRNDPIPF